VRRGVLVERCRLMFAIYAAAAAAALDKPTAVNCSDCSPADASNEAQKHADENHAPPLIASHSFYGNVTKGRLRGGAGVA